MSILSGGEVAVAKPSEMMAGANQTVHVHFDHGHASSGRLGGDTNLCHPGFLTGIHDMHELLEWNHFVCGDSDLRMFYITVRTEK